MSCTYLSVDQIIHINSRQDGGVGVADQGGIESAAHRPSSGAMGTERFPSIWDKAAAYVHAFATTQHFTDGNKRTAWFAAVTFLRLNDHALPDIPTIEAETFVQAVAQRIFDTDGDPDATITKAAEWFETRWRTQHAGPGRDHRLEYAFLSQHTEWQGALSLPNIYGFGSAGVSIPEGAYPAAVPIWLMLRYHFDHDVHRESHTLRMQIVPADDTTRRANRHTDIQVSDINPPSSHPAHSRTGLLPWLKSARLEPLFKGPGRHTVQVWIDGRLVAELPYTVTTVSSVPDTPEGLT